MGVNAALLRSRVLTRELSASVLGAEERSVGVAAALPVAVAAALPVAALPRCRIDRVALCARRIECRRRLRGVGRSPRLHRRRGKPI